jgi:putative membrane protein
LNEPSTIAAENAEERYKLHPVGLLIGFISGLPQLVFPIFAAIFGTRSSEFGSVYVIAIIAAILFISLFFRWLAWTRFRYVIGEEEIRVESGILNRNVRSIPYERIQDVSIEQKLLPRLFGLGEVKFETGSGDGDEGKLSFVSTQEGERLRELIRDRKEGVVRSEASAIAEEQNEDSAPIFAMDNKRVVTLGLFEFSLVIFAILMGAAQQFDFLLDFDLWDIGAWIGIVEAQDINLEAISWTARILGAMAALLALLAVGIASGVVKTLLREHGFRLERTAKGFRRRRGLTTLTDVVMPAHRVQAAIIQTGFIRKRFGWHALKFVSLAQDSKEEASHVVAPLAKLEEIWPIATEAKISPPSQALEFHRLDPRLWFDQWLLLAPIFLVSAGWHYTLTDLPLLSSLILLAALLIGAFFWLDWRHKSHTRDDSQVYFRSGWWTPKMTIAPQLKIQSVEIRQSPLARLRGLAEIEFGIAGGTLEFPGLKLADAMQIREEVLSRIVELDFSDVNRAD